MSATISTSVSQTLNTVGGGYTTAGTAATFKDQDYGAQALSSPDTLRQFFQQLNPIVQSLQQVTNAVNVNNLDGEVLSFTVPGIVSDWQPLTLAAGVPQTAGNTLLTQGNAPAANAIRKDPYGTVWLAWNVNAAQVLYVLPTPYWPPLQVQATGISVTTTGTVTSSAAGQGLLQWPCVSLSPGQVPGFPVYLQVAQGRTPAAVFLMGAKPVTNQSLYATNTGLYLGPLTGSWTWLSGTSPIYSTTGLSTPTNTIRINNVFGLNASGAPPNLSYVVTVLVLYSLPGQSTGA